MFALVGVGTVASLKALECVLPTLHISFPVGFALVLLIGTAATQFLFSRFGEFELRVSEHPRGRCERLRDAARTAGLWTAALSAAAALTGVPLALDLGPVASVFGWTSFACLVVSILAALNVARQPRRATQAPPTV